MGLILERQLNEKIIIGDPANPLATIGINRIRGDKVRLDISAPKTTPIHREEVALAIIRDGAKRKGEAS